MVGVRARRNARERFLQIASAPTGCGINKSKGLTVPLLRRTPCKVSHSLEVSIKLNGYLRADLRRMRMVAFGSSLPLFVLAVFARMETAMNFFQTRAVDVRVDLGR